MAKKSTKKSIRSREYFYTVIYEPVKEGGYQVTVPLLPGLITYGRRLEEAREMARDAIRCYFDLPPSVLNNILKQAEISKKDFLKIL